MTLRQQWITVGAVVLALGSAFVLVTSSMRDDLRAVGAGSDAPSFRAKVLGEKAYKSLGDYRGRVLVVNFWATYCDPCIKEIPSLRAFQQEFGPKGVALLAISGDFPSVTDDSIATAARNLHMNFEVLRDDPGSAIQRAYQTTGFPETFIIDKQGVIRRRVWEMMTGPRVGIAPW
jgi:peroxiredoxin